MGIKSTVGITRSEAIAYIARKICNLTDDQLAIVMETIYGEDLLFNYKVVESEEECHCPHKFNDVRCSHDEF